MSNSNYVLNINYNINEEKFAKVHCTSYLRKLREGFFLKMGFFIIKKQQKNDPAIMFGCYIPKPEVFDLILETKPAFCYIILCGIHVMFRIKPKVVVFEKIYSRNVYKNMEEFSLNSLNYEPGKFTDGYLSVSSQFIGQLYLQAG